MSVLVVVPTLNEVGTVRKIVEAVRSHGYSILVVDDGSDDGTLDEIEDQQSLDSQVHVMARGEKRGLASAYRDGFRWASERGFDAVCEMDADFSHDPADLPRLVRRLDTADAVLGSRYVNGGGVHGWSRHRLLMSASANTLTRLLTGCPVKDATSGLRAFRTSAAVALASVTRAEGYAFQIEMTLAAWRAGYRILEVPIVFSERLEGTSKMSGAIAFEALATIALAGFDIRRGAPTHVARPAFTPRCTTVRKFAGTVSP